MKIVTPSDDAEIRSLLETPSNIILDFYADWCGPCKVITKSFQEIKKDNLFKDVTLIKIDKTCYRNCFNYVRAISGQQAAPLMCL